MRRRAVIFDDNDLIRRMLWYFFDHRGYEVFTFPEPGLCPLHVAQECPCPADTSCADLIISDVNMMGTNGIDYVEQLIDKGCKQRHFALISGSFSEMDLVRASKMGCKLFTKPLDIEAIQVWIESVEQGISPERLLYDWIEAD
jgi:DNA-binding response OmpR family regulator